MHTQHRSPDPTKIERATATSTVALFFYCAVTWSLQVCAAFDLVRKEEEEEEGACVRACVPVSKENKSRKFGLKLEKHFPVCLLKCLTYQFLDGMVACFLVVQITF